MRFPARIVWERFFMVGKGIGESCCFTCRTLAGRRNELSIAKFVQRSAESARREEFENVDKVFGRFSARTESLLRRLDDLCGEARTQLLQESMRAATGVSGPEGVYEATVSPRMLMALNGSLRDLFGIAKNERSNKGIFAIRRIGVAADRLISLFEEIVRSNSPETAKEAYDGVVVALDGVDREFGFNLAPFPERPVSGPGTSGSAPSKGA